MFTIIDGNSGQNICGLIFPDNSSTICIDPSTYEDEINELLERTKRTLKLVILTHLHLDHMASLESLKKRWGCRVYHGRDEYARVCGEVIENEIVVETQGDLRITLIPAPGHTKGDILVYLQIPECRVLFTGDLIFVKRCGKAIYPGSDLDAFYESIRMVDERFDDRVIVVPGHSYGGMVCANLGTIRTLNPCFGWSDREVFIREKKKMDQAV